MVFYILAYIFNTLCRGRTKGAELELNWEKQHLTRSKGGYLPYPIFGDKFAQTFSPFISKIWNKLPSKTQTMNLPDDKAQLKLDLKPKKNKTFSIGPKTTNSLLTRFRTNRTDLNQNKFTIGLTDDPSCDCHAKYESSERYLLDCFLYTDERQNLFTLVEQFVPTFTNKSKKLKFSILTRGLDNSNPDNYHTNKNISLAVQYFILKTNRFSDLNT